MNLTRKILIHILTLIYLVAINGNLISLAEYYIRYDYIVKNLCVQKDKVINKCKGSCHLKANLDKLDETSNESTKSIEIKNLFMLDIHFSANSLGMSNFNNLFSYLALKNQMNNYQNYIKPLTPPPKFRKHNLIELKIS